MNVHPGEFLRWQGDEHRVVAVRPAYVTLRRQVEQAEDIEVLRADLEANAEPAGVRSSAELLDLRLLDELAPADRKIVDVWLEELEHLSDLLDKGVILADGPPREVLTAERLRAVYAVETFLGEAGGKPIVLPLDLTR